MQETHRLIDYYLPPGEGFVLESLVATTYQVDFEFLEEELLADGARRAFARESPEGVSFGVGAETSKSGSVRAVRSWRLRTACSAFPAHRRHPCRCTQAALQNITLQMWVRENRASGAPPDRRMRLIVGSANLTRQGFRHNYECVVSRGLWREEQSPAFSVDESHRARSTDRRGIDRAHNLSRQLAAFSEPSRFVA